MGVQDSNSHTHPVAVAFASDESQNGFAFLMKAVVRATEWIFSGELKIPVDALPLTNLQQDLSEAADNLNNTSSYYRSEESCSIRDYFDSTEEIQVLFPEKELCESSYRLEVNKPRR